MKCAKSVVKQVARQQVLSVEMVCPGLAAPLVVKQVESSPRTPPMPRLARRGARSRAARARALCSVLCLVLAPHSSFVPQGVTQASYAAPTHSSTLASVSRALDTRLSACQPAPCAVLSCSSLERQAGSPLTCVVCKNTNAQGEGRDEVANMTELRCEWWASELASDHHYNIISASSGPTPRSGAWDVASPPRPSLAGLEQASCVASSAHRGLACGGRGRDCDGVVVWFGVLCADRKVLDVEVSVSPAGLLPSTPSPLDLRFKCLATGSAAVWIQVSQSLPLAQNVLHSLEKRFSHLHVPAMLDVPVC